MRCRVCDMEIPPARLAALPDVDTCVEHSEVEPVVGFMQWEHKTAPVLEIDTPLAREHAGRKHRYGPHFSFDKKEGKWGCAAPMEEARGLSDLAERLRREARGLPEPEADLEVATFIPSRCHPERPKAVPGGYCLECALELQRRRLG